MSEDKLKWRFDVSTFRLIGRDLITDRITALFELVKNSYDANAQRVDIIFEEISLENAVVVNDGQITPSPASKITIKDDGFGMSFNDVKDKWMVIGTSSKRKKPITPAPFNRRCVGEKGIGRFAVDKLGDKVNIITKKKGSKNWLNVEIDWEKYFPNTPLGNENDTEDNDIILFTDIENNYVYINEHNNVSSSGTILDISSIREVWTYEDILRFSKEANKIVSPYTLLNPPFDIYITAEEYEMNEWKVKKENLDFATIQAEIDFDKIKDKQETLYFNQESGKIETKESPIRNFGGVKLRLFYFNDQARKKYHTAYKNDYNRIDGIKIYRDGIITTPFAETEANPDKKRDILGIDKRLWQDVFNKISTREIIGILEIGKENNPQIIDATNRQDFIDNEEYRSLKEFIIEQLVAFEDYKIYLRKQKKKKVSEELNEAKNDVDTFASAVNKVVESNPSLKTELKPLLEQAKKTSSSFKKAIKEQKEAEKENIRKENMYMSIMSLQEYAIHIAHAVRTSLGKIERKAEFFYEYYPDPEEEEYFLLYAKEIYEEMKILDEVINFMLSYSKSNLSFEDIKLKELIEGLFQTYQTSFKAERINSSVEITGKLQVYSNKQFFLDIFQNLIHNSIKALRYVKEKIIRCSGYIQDDNLIITLSDNGCGIPLEKRDWVFGIFNTTTEETGGAGMGLYIVKTRVESLNGKIEIIDSEFGNQGTTFKITVPFKK